MQERLIISTPREKINPLAFQNSFVYDCYVQIRSILSNKLSEKHANLFAEPVADSLKNCIDWYTPIAGKATLLNQCPPEQQNIVRTYLASLAKDIAKCAQDLKASQNNTQVIAGNILELALQYPDEDNCIYIIDNQPIIICWGFEPASTGVRAQDLSRLSNLALIEQKTPPKEATKEAAPIVQSEIPIVNNVHEQNRPFIFNWAWLIIPLIILLLLSLLYLLYSGRITIPGFSMPNFSMPSFSTPSVSPDKASLKIPHKNIYDQQLGDLYLELEKARALCLAEQKIITPHINAPQDVKSLQGSWLCETDIVTSKNVSVVMKFTFDDKGIGQVTINSGGDICTAPTTGIFSTTSSFTITTDTEIKCPSGNAFAKQSISCINTAQGTICSGRNLNDFSTWNARFQKGT